MQIVTYNLRQSSNSSAGYYDAIHSFAKDFYSTAEDDLGHIVSSYQDFIRETGSERLRSRPEYHVELLTFGMVWRRYLGASQHSSRVMLAFMKWLFDVRSSNQRLKPLVDRLRGLLASIYLVPAIGRDAKQRYEVLPSFAKLLLWLEASGEFRDECKRLSGWLQFFKGMEPALRDSFLCSILKSFDGFKEAARVNLATYTDGLGSFLTNEYRGYRFREDVIFCGKDEVEYHLNMLGAEIANWGFFPEFKEAKRRVVLAPSCMRLGNGAKCKAVTSGIDIRCTLCSPDCNIGQIAKQGKQEGWEVFIVPHSSSFTKWLKKWENSKDTSLVAIACLLNLVPGGYQMRELNIPAQCLLLDYCGCKKHWHKDGIATDVNRSRLKKIVTCTHKVVEV